MKFLLIASQKKVKVKEWVCQETTPVGSVLPPMDLAYLASIIVQKSHEVKIVDLRLFDDPVSALENAISTFDPNFVILNLTTTSAKQDYELLQLVPKNVVKICFGTHAMSVPQECFDKGIDLIINGDPEAGIINLIDNKMDGIESAGVLTRYTQKKPPAHISNLDSLPFAAYNLVDFDKYHAPYARKRFSIMLTSRGCPFLCTFCLYPVLFGKNYRARSSENIVNEMQFAQDKYKINEFLFLDATFNNTEKRVVDFCDEITKRGLKISWMCNMRASAVNQEMLIKMKKAGCVRIFYGVEDPDFLNEIKKGLTWAQTMEAFHLTKRVGIKTVAFMMLFDRADITEKEYVDKVLCRLRELSADAFQCNIAIPFPGTKLYEQQNGRALAVDWDLFDPGGTQSPYTTKLDLVRIKRKVYVQFAFNHPIGILKILSEMQFKSVFGILRSFFRF